MTINGTKGVYKVKHIFGIIQEKQYLRGHRINSRLDRLKKFESKRFEYKFKISLLSFDELNNY